MFTKGNKYMTIGGWEATVLDDKGGFLQVHHSTKQGVTIHLPNGLIHPGNGGIPRPMHDAFTLKPMLGRLSLPKRGFTIIELMISIVIIALLASITVPAFGKYVKRSRTAEAIGIVNRVWTGAVTYFESEHVDNGNIAPKQFPQGVWGEGNCCLYPNGTCRGASALACKNPILQALGDCPSDEHHFMRYYEGGTGEGTSATFTASAHGDLDCDTTLSTFMRHGSLDSNGTIRGMHTIIVNEIE